MFATTGMACYDYLIGDQEVIPASEEPFYCEKILRVPGSYLTFEVTYPVPEVVEPPCLSTCEITFGCLAPLYKITPQCIAAWARILHESPGSTLLLRGSALKSPGARRYLSDAFERLGVTAQRLKLLGPAAHYEFLETYSQIDIALETLFLTSNGGTTTTEAIWQGVPVLTFWGDRWVSRTSASILRAGGLGEFVASGLDEYVEQAVALANSAETSRRLRELRHEMRGKLRGSAVCDGVGFAREMERIYVHGNH